jgi:AraC-like DNA-binding protein
MNESITFRSVNDYNAFNKTETLHPLVSVVDLSSADPRLPFKMNFGIYCIVLKKVKCGDLRYGNQNYDYQEGTLLFFAPGQVLEADPTLGLYQPSGLALIFHPDFLPGTTLAKRMAGYNFFSYSIKEGLHLSDDEKQIVTECFHKIEYELSQPGDRHSKGLIASNIELFLDYCTRFYERQFETRGFVNKGILEKFDDLLQAYLASDRPRFEGLPTVSSCAATLNISANYLGDIVRKESEISAKDYINAKIIQLAKEKIFNLELTLSEVAFSLGFKYPQHFSRLFKQRVGQSPNDYRKMITVPDLNAS